MRCPSLRDLPPAPSGKTGWPWTEESVRLPEHNKAGAPWPAVTIVTPSFNQGKYLEETIRSILLQGYPNVEYIVLDGGSTDNSVEVIKKYSRWIDFWVSEPDGGQSAAINRGLRMGKGSWATFINSDDMLCRDALANHFSDQNSTEDVLYVGDCIHIDENGKVISTHRGQVKTLEDLVHIESVWRSGSIDQPAAIFPRALAVQIGGVDEADDYTMDYGLWGKFLLAGAQIQYTGISFGIFRWHPGQKTQEHLKQTESMLDAAVALVTRADSLSPETKRTLLDELKVYRETYPKRAWKQSGRLAKLGIPASLAIPVRNFRQRLRRTINNLIFSNESK